MNDVRLAMLIASGSELEALSRAKCLYALQIFTDDLPFAFTGEPYAVALDGRGGVEPRSWTAEGLPAGLAVVGDEIQGTPTESGTFTVTLRVTDAEGAEDVTELELVVDPPA